jgi:N-acetylglucosamine malate deacetylase 1
MDFTPLLRNLAGLFAPSPLIPKSQAPITIMLLSPHPDDESIMSSLPLRLMHENGAKVINVAVSFGSNKAREAARRRELKNACQHLNFQLEILSDNWATKARELKQLIRQHQPALIMAPHLKDHHPTHIRTGELLKTTLGQLKNVETIVAWTEYWGQMAKPNLLVEVPTELVHLQMQALALHEGEVARNPFHLRLPAWMMDNVRRGSEVIGGAGITPPHFPFGVILTLQTFRDGKFRRPRALNPFWSGDQDLAKLLAQL